jgi:hypothetical protein
MKRILAAFALLALAACTPPANSGAEAVVRDIYATVEQNIGTSTTPLSAIPMTSDLLSLVDRAEAEAEARNEPFLDGDIAANCQDCTSIGELEIGPQQGPEAVPADEGHVILEARFKLNGNEDRSVLYDLVETPEGWRVDNILADGFNLRSEAAAYLVDAAAAEPVEPAAP